VLGDGDEQQVEEVALVVGRFSTGDQKVEVLREGEATHEVAREITAAHLHAVGIGLADVGDRLARLPDLHAASCPHAPFKCEAPPERGFV